MKMHTEMITNNAWEALRRSAGRTMIVLLCAAMILPFLPKAKVSAESVESNAEAYYYDEQGRMVDTDLMTAWNNALSKGTGMGIAQSVTMSDRLVVGANQSVFIELNGHVLNRNLSGTSGTTDGEVIYVDTNATVEIYGGSKNDPASGVDDLHDIPVWHTLKENEGPELATERICGGVLAGGYSTAHAGGIDIRENATASLHYVTVAGNRAEQKAGSDGYGGGVLLARDYAKLNLDHSSIVYNYAYNDGGGIYVNGGAGRTRADYCTVRMTHSHVDFNGCEDNGAGVAIDGEHFKLLGDAVPFEKDAIPTKNEIFADCYKDRNGTTAYGSTIANNVVWDSDTSGGGAGVYVWDTDSTIAGVNVVHNQALYGGLGGGILTESERTTIYDCNISYNFWL